jgi:hypothetical protein
MDGEIMICLWTGCQGSHARKGIRARVIRQLTNLDWKPYSTWLPVSQKHLCSNDFIVDFTTSKHKTTMASSKHPIKTTTNSATNSSAPAILPPHTFDTLPALHELLARVEQGSAANDIFPGLEEELDAADIGSHYTSDALAPLAPKDLPEEVLKVIKSKMRAALRAVEALPDVDRSVEEQEAEIAALEERVRKQRDMLRSLGELAGGMAGRVA